MEQMVGVEPSSAELHLVAADEAACPSPSSGTPVTSTHQSVTGSDVISTKAMAVSLFGAVASRGEVLDRFAEGGMGWINGPANSHGWLLKVGMGDLYLA